MPMSSRSMDGPTAFNFSGPNGHAVSGPERARTHSSIALMLPGTQAQIRL